ncbi:MAG: Rieske (2Fe-2S) protein [Bacteroidetes bacterium]|nr:Rieske (2Fe-2S) protein [Bacteroidota bacterium]
MQRRKFLKSSCNLCMLAASGYLFSELAACSPAAYHVFKTEIVNNHVEIPLTEFAQSSLQFVRPNGWYYDIAVQKKADNSYEALLLQCTHQSNQLVPNGNGYTCSLHGSQFNKDGDVTKGPAEKPLKHYPVTVNQDKLSIQLKS